MEGVNEQLPKASKPSTLSIARNLLWAEKGDVDTREFCWIAQLWLQLIRKLEALMTNEQEDVFLQNDT
jgi:hypothetical protein